MKIQEIRETEQEKEKLYRKCQQFLIQLVNRQLFGMDDDKADEFRDQMDDIWYELDSEQHCRLEELSADLVLLYIPDEYRKD